jgi:plastocyanin
MRIPRVLALAVATALMVPAAAQAASYPPPSNPGKPSPRPGGRATLKVCKAKSCKYKTIQKAVDAARAGDTVKVADGTYKESVKVLGHAKDAIKLVGNRSKPTRVRIDLRSLPSAKAQNGVMVNGANNVIVDGFGVVGYKGNGFFIVNAVGYTIQHAVAAGPGVYGFYAFNSKGGLIQDDVAYYNNDSGFYIGQTPPQTRPKRSIVRRIKSYANELGWSGTNMRYVTITDSDFYDNALGIVPNALASEKYPPAQHNVISGNRIFWNNFNYYLGAPFKVKQSSQVSVPYPIGVGVFLFGATDTTISGNQIFGNYLTAVALIPQILFDKKKCTKSLACQGDPTVLRDNRVTGNTFGKGGADLNGRDLFYDGSGTGNCFENNTGAINNTPQSNSTFVPCTTPATPTTVDDAVLPEGIKWAGATDHEQYWIKHPHQTIAGFTPLEHYQGAKSAAAPKPVRRTVKVADDYYLPKKLTVPAGSTITWSWPDYNTDTHDVYFKSKPRRAARFHSEAFAADVTVKRKLTFKGTYKIVCTFHEDMTQTIVVK